MYYFVVFTQFLVFSTTQESLKKSSQHDSLYWFAVLLIINMLQLLKILRNKCDSIMQTQVIRINGV